MGFCLVTLDADMTLWDHPDISSLTLPFKKVDENALIDAKGETLRLFDGVRDLLKGLKKRGLIVSLVTWNKPEHIDEAVRLLEIGKFFKFVEVEFTPDKHLLIARILASLSEKGVQLEPREILYVDDNTRHLKDIYDKVGRVIFLQMWKDVKEPREILTYIDNVHKMARREGFKAVLFDLDLTLIDSSKAIVNSIEHVLDLQGYSIQKEEIAKLVGKVPLEEQFQALVPSLSDDEVNEYVNCYRQHYLIHHIENTKLYPHVKETLQNLRSLDFKLGVVTGKYKKPVLEILNHFQLTPLLNVIVTSYDVKKHKPAPDVVFEAARRLEVNSSECIFVGDSLADVEAGKRAGCFTIALSRNEVGRRQLKEAEPDILLDDLKWVSRIARAYKILAGGIH
ncbi:MAG: magnesium-dependent phosphatase-1 [Candidatus Bathyarchaeota archaeon]|nr:MAG: magnesium-dependent phosphatase-1 [Candidatus Bathyarchaeota archaeon]